MSSSQTLDLQAAHRYFSADCFNRAWTLIEKGERSAADDEQMLLLAFASLWHWSQRPECTDRNKSIGYWQLSRICATLGRAHEALHYAQQCQKHSVAEPPFYAACAHEAMARAAAVRRYRTRQRSSAGGPRPS